MPSTKRVVAFRPNEKETKALKQLAEEFNMPESKILSLALKEYMENFLTKEQLAEIKSADKGREI
jgi:predicted transcriptional regulator